MNSKTLRELRLKWDDMTPKARQALFISLTPEQQGIIATSWEFLARPAQLSPESFGDEHMYWIILSGRGFGKTRTGAETVLDHILALGKEARVALIGPTAADVRDTMIEGESGLMACARRRGIQCTYEPSKRRVTFPSGALAVAFSGEKPDRLRGPQHTFAWCDELTSWEYDQDAWDMMMFGLRLGPSPSVVITTTPKPRRLMKTLLKDSRSYITRGSTYDNKDNLAPAFLKAVEDRYEGTRLGRQELYGELLDDNPDALWCMDFIEPKRIKDLCHLSPEDLCMRLNITRIVVAIDPAVTTGEDSDETGIMVVGEDAYGGYVVLEDGTGKYSPDEWGRVVLGLYNKWSADRVIAEVNQGGDMVEYTLRTIDPSVSYRGVRAVKGKRVRAEPIAALYEQHKVAHIGLFNKLEEEMCSFAPDSFDGSPDRLDALVWGLTDLALQKGGGIRFI